jgi:TRAP-type C4-dicarboxylate transport system permease small subunit
VLSLWLRRASQWIGGAALLGAVGVDFVSVVARHVGLRLLGSIEIIQFCIVAAISSALVLATLEGSHAAVHLLVTRVSPRAQALLHRVSDGFSVVAFAALLVGNLWVFSDLLPLEERSDLLHLPFAPARAFFCVALALCAILALVHMISRPTEDQPSDV